MPICVAPRHVDASRDFLFIYFLRTSSARGKGGGGALPDFFFFFFSPVQQTTSGIGHRVKKFFRVGNQCAECEKQQQQQHLYRRSLGFTDYVEGLKTLCIPLEVAGGPTGEHTLALCGCD